MIRTNFLLGLILGGKGHQNGHGLTPAPLFEQSPNCRHVPPQEDININQLKLAQLK